jgi:NTP pyrophosphatase (non-canonical NTP hydrolase)
MTSDIQEIIETLRKFNDDRDWEQFHNAKDLAIALSIEAAELSEAYLWKTAKDAKIEKVREELADIFNYAFMIADKYNLDVRDICLSKIARNAEKYPVEKAKGNAEQEEFIKKMISDKKLPQLKILTRKQRKEIDKKNINYLKSQIGDQRNPLAVQEECYDWILENVYKEFDFSDLPNNICLVFARMTFSSVYKDELAEKN